MTVRLVIAHIDGVLPHNGSHSPRLFAVAMHMRKQKLINVSARLLPSLFTFIKI
jgi:hypothetical protein